MPGLERQFRFEQTSGLLMIGAMGLALLAANSQLAPIYSAIHQAPIQVRFGPLVIDGPLVRWINEGLMVIFFLLVGLEIKREFLEGNLSSAKCAALPAFAALGGMVVPAAIYIAITGFDPATIKGWAIPIATDIVLALGILSLLGSRVPISLKAFLTALAIFDDIAAVLVIGIFYGETISLPPLTLAVLALGGLALLNFFCITRPAAYVAVGLVLWVAMHKAGFAAALAGVIIALAVPLRAPGCRYSSPLRVTERRLHPWSALLIVPLFAFFNAGIDIGDDVFASLISPVSIGIAAGLFIGKQVGVFSAAWLAVRFGLGQLPEGVNWLQLYAVTLFAGIGFTMSLFVACLAFSDPATIAPAKLAIITGSLLSAIAGITIVYFTTRTAQKIPVEVQKLKSSTGD